MGKIPKFWPPLAWLMSLTLMPITLSPELAPLLVVWNVGQGQWLTWIGPDRCTHFDMGGERPPPSSLQFFCRDRANQLWLSHGDWDHMSFVQGHRWPGLCLLSPRPQVHSLAKAKRLKTLSRCLAAERPKSLLSLWEPEVTHTSANASSAVVQFGPVLIPGDSPASEEKKWAHRTLIHSRILILGHHGSRTSTSEFLLQQAPQLRQGVASARRRRYGHPHRETLARLRAHAVAPLTTEDWGHIAIRF